ncbi:MAG: sporulation protein [Acidimicrobiia bacterium]|nr:sporulation protein [Acidimicrobiia bacterium]
MTKVDEILAEARDALTVRRVYGEPFEKNGVSLIPAAAVRGGGGAGEGDGDEGSGTGGGFGMMARPVGAYQINGDEVIWIPAADTTRVILVGQVVAIVALLVLRSILGRRANNG